MKEKHKRSSFSGKLGYVMAVAGSAVGLGNIWRFPYLAAKYGGGAFLLTYFVLAVTFGFTLLITETALGRKTRLGPIGAFRTLGAKKLMVGGWLNGIVPMLIVPYYCVLGGWVCKYLFGFISGDMAAMASDSYFNEFITNPAEPMIWLLVFAAVVFIAVLSGVEKGIEKLSKLLMPLLVLMALGLAIYSATRPGALEGVKYYLLPDASHFSLMTVVAAMGQMFFSLSIAMGILYTYGSYMKDDINMEGAITQIEIMDTLIAFLAGMMIIPAVFAFAGGSPETLQAGPSLMFITMPKVFDAMPGGTIGGLLFFTLVFFAAVTSAISLLETSVATISEETGFSRKRSILVMAGIVLILAAPCSLGFGLLSGVTPLGMSILDFFDFITNSLMMPLAAIGTGLLVLKVTGISTVIDEVQVIGKFRRKKLYKFCIRFVVIPGLLIILASSILSALGIISV